MRLDEFLDTYSTISLAMESDFSEVEHFLKSVEMELSGLNLRYEFSGGLSSFLTNQTLQAYVLLIKNEDGSIHGCGVISIRIYLRAGEKIRAAYLSDVRIGRGVCERGRGQWKQCYHDLIHKFSEIEEFKGCVFLFAIVFDQNKKAMAHIQKSQIIKYQSIHHYQVFTLLGPSPLRSLRRIDAHSTYTLRWYIPEDERELFQFIKRENDKKDWADYFSPGDPEDEWERRKSNWDGHHPSQFLVARDSRMRIVGAFMPWSPVKGRKLVINKLSRGFKLLNVVLRVMRKKVYGEGGAFSLLYLTHLNLDSELTQKQKSDVLQMMIDQLYREGLAQKHHGVVFCHSPENFLGKMLKKYLSHQLQNTVFAISPGPMAMTQIKTMALEAAIL